MMIVAFALRFWLHGFPKVERVLNRSNDDGAARDGNTSIDAENKSMTRITTSLWDIIKALTVFWIIAKAILPEALDFVLIYKFF
jgi:hypothetical protein